MTWGFGILDLAGARRDFASPESHCHRNRAAVNGHWPHGNGALVRIAPQDFSADFPFFRCRHGLRWPFSPGRGASPMPMIVLIGSEAPGRTEWSLARGAQAQMSKPVSDIGAYFAPQIARADCQAQHRMAAQIDQLRDRLAGRETVVRAVMVLVAQGYSDKDAFAWLRRLATDRQERFDAAAERVLAQFPEARRKERGR